MENRKVFIRPIPGRESVFKIHEWVGQNGKKLNKTKLSRFSKDTFSPLYSRSLGMLKTGLYNKIPNRYKDYSISQLGEKYKHLIGIDEITIQEKLEYEHQRDPGFYTSKMPKNGEPRTFMLDFKFKLGDGTTILDLTIPEHEIAYYMFLESKFVAKSLNEYLTHKSPYATYYIAMEDEDQELQFKANKARGTATSRLNSDVMTEENLVLVTKALGWYAEQRFTALYNDVESRIKSADLKKVPNDVSEFMKVANLLDTPSGREELNARAILFNLTKARIVSESKGTFTWVSKGMIIGYNKEEAVAFILDPNKQDAITSMTAELRAKSLI